jgi:hypothetical protein
MKRTSFLIILLAATCFAHSTEYVINHCPVTPVREEPSHAAEQATQLLFGELCEVLQNTQGGSSFEEGLSKVRYHIIRDTTKNAPKRSAFLLLSYSPLDCFTHHHR